jgi:hypothetical protein
MTDRAKVLAWLKRIGETDQAVIDEVIEACKTDPSARAYYLMRSKEAETNQFADKVKHIQELAQVQKLKSRRGRTDGKAKAAQNDN